MDIGARQRSSRRGSLNVASSVYQSLKSLKYLVVPHAACDMTQEKMP
jgi:hypothetical protein